eukprot:COSAG01_NODE_902_length_12849_cov_26.940706_4_plen_170_part_00
MVHSGRDRAGHYVALRRTVTGSWLKADDSSVWPCGMDEVRGDGATTGAVLAVYRAYVRGSLTCSESTWTQHSLALIWRSSLPQHYPRTYGLLYGSKPLQVQAGPDAVALYGRAAYAALKGHCYELTEPVWQQRGEKGSFYNHLRSQLRRRRWAMRERPGRAVLAAAVAC